MSMQPKKIVFISSSCTFVPDQKTAGFGSGSGSGGGGGIGGGYALKPAYIHKLIVAIDEDGQAWQRENDGEWMQLPSLPEVESVKA